jgi:hypothetical protein
MLRYAIHAYIALNYLLILREFYKPTSGYKGAIARNGVLKQVIITNAIYV